MLKTVTAIASAMLLAGLNLPAHAQEEEEEEARTTYQISFVSFASNAAADRWVEMQDKYVIPSREAAGQPQSTVHWLVDGPYDLMIVREMPNGMATLDTHTNPASEAFMAKLLELAGSQEELDKLMAETSELSDTEMTYYSHTHP